MIKLGLLVSICGWLGFVVGIFTDLVPFELFENIGWLGFGLTGLGLFLNLQADVRSIEELGETVPNHLKVDRLKYLLLMVVPTVIGGSAILGMPLVNF